MNNSATKVGEIFREAGTAFTELSKITMMLHPTEDASGAKWHEEDLESLRGCINRFAVELNHLSQHIKKRTMANKIKHLLEIDTGTINAVGDSPPRQQQHKPQHLHFNEILYENDDQDLRRFNPQNVPLTPPINFMQEDLHLSSPPSAPAEVPAPAPAPAPDRAAKGSNSNRRARKRSKRNKKTGSGPITRSQSRKQT